METRHFLPDVSEDTEESYRSKFCLRGQAEDDRGRVKLAMICRRKRLPDNLIFSVQGSTKLLTVKLRISPC